MKFVGGKLRAEAIPNFSAFGFNETNNLFLPSVANLNPALTINGQTVYPLWRYNGKDASTTGWPSWGYGPKLAYQTGTAPTFNFGSPLIGASDDSVKFNAGAWYLAPSPIVNPGAKDFVFEFVGILYSYTGMIISTYVAPDTQSIQFYPDSTTGRVETDIGGVSAGGSTYTAASSSMTWWIHFMFFYDKSGSSQFYVNGVASGAAKAVSTYGAITITRNTAFCANPNASSPASVDAYSYLGWWEKDSWLDTHLQATVAATRFAQLTGMYPQKATGTYLPSVATRTASAHLEKFINGNTRKLYYVGGNWMRTSTRNNSLNQKKYGVMVEPAATNLVIRSCDTPNWVTSTGIAGSSTSNVGPNGIAYTTCNIHEDSSTGGHYIQSQAATTTPGKTYTASIFLKTPTNGRTWAALATAAVSSVYYDLSTPAIGAAPGTTSSIENWGNGWVRCIYTFVAVNASHAITVYACSGYGGWSYTGGNKDSLIIWCLQIEAGTYASSPIVTTTAVATRDADSLRYVGTTNVTPKKGTLSYKMLLPTYTQDIDIEPVVISAGGTAATSIRSRITRPSTNYCIQSQDLHASWGFEQATGVNTTTTTAPDGTTTNYSVLREDGTAAAVHDTYTVVAVVAGYTYTWSGWFQSINRSKVFVCHDAKCGGCGYKVSLGDGSIYSTQGSPVAGGVENWGNGWYRIWIAATCTSAGTAYPTIYALDDTYSAAFNGATQASIYIWGAQFEIGSTVTPYIATTTVAVARSNSVHWFRAFNTSNQADMYGTTNTFDNTVHELKDRWETGLATAFTDTTQQGNTDTSVSVPTSLDRIDIGTSLGLISDLKIWGDPK